VDRLVAAVLDLQLERNRGLNARALVLHEQRGPDPAKTLE
jgi:hypothetical protein